MLPFQLTRVIARRSFCTQQVPHVPVLCKEVVSMLSPSRQSVLIDMTFGAGGHTKALLNEEKGIKIICLDRDPLAHLAAVQMSKEYPQLIPRLGKFSDLPSILKDLQISFNSVDGIIFDFGCSSMQLDTPDRGFSLSKDGPLDMRMNPTEQEVTAADVVNHANEKDLANIFKIYGEEKHARKMARSIIEARYCQAPLVTTSQLAEVIRAACWSQSRQDKLQRPSHVATKVFQALRIFVNDELNEINCGLLVAHKFLKVGGRLVTVSFHSLEDTIVKRHLTGHLEENAKQSLPLRYSSYEPLSLQESLNDSITRKWMPLNKHVILPSDDEVKRNPRSRSAKLRAAVKVD